MKLSLRISFICLLFLFSTTCISQSFYKEWGATIGLDYYRGPVSSSQISGGFNASYTSYNYMRGVSWFSYIWGFRLNMAELGESAAISIYTQPSFGLAYANSKQKDNGIGALNIPILLSVELGAGSTYSTSASHGLSLGFGIDINKFPILLTDNIGDPSPITFWQQPVVGLGYRAWLGEQLVTMYTKFGWLTKQPYREGQFDTLDSKQPFTLRFGFLFMTDY